MNTGKEGKGGSFVSWWLTGGSKVLWNGEEVDVQGQSCMG